MKGPIRTLRPMVAAGSLILAGLLLHPGLVAAGETESDREPAAYTLQQGRALMTENDYAGAEKVFHAITKAEPDNGRAWYFLGYFRHAQDKLDGALLAHKKAAEFPTPYNVMAHYNAACVYARKGEKDEAFAWLKRAVDAGFRDREMLRTDTDLESLRGDTRLKGLIPPMLSRDEIFTEKPRILNVINGEDSNDQFGWVARIVGDVDGDGVTDFATSAPTRAEGGPFSGKLYVYSTKSGKLLFSHTGEPGEQLGNGVAGAGDVNKDGVPDVIAGAPSWGDKPGNAYVYSGKDGARLLSLVKGETGDSFGHKVTGIGDIDGDGFADVAVGATGADGSAKDSGRVYGYSGKDGSMLFELDGEGEQDGFGSALDGSADPEPPLMIVGANNAGEGQKGRAYVYRFKKAKPELVFTIDRDKTTQNLGLYFVSIVGDVNGDSVPDAYASDFSNSAAGPSTGRIWVHSGKDGKQLLVLTGKEGEGFGTSPSQAGDVNGDGHDDLVIGAWQNREGAASGGKVYLHSGQDGGLLTAWTCREPQDTFGFDAQGLGDVDGDGAIDFLLTSAWSTVSGTKSGRIFVIAGPQFKKFDTRAKNADNRAPAK